MVAEKCQAPAAGASCTLHVMPRKTSSLPVAFVTGAARGIGLAIAEWFLETGHRVALIDIDGAELKRAARRLDDPDRVLAVTCDVSKEKQVKAAVKDTVKAFGRIDALVNNAGVAVFKPLLETSLDKLIARPGAVSCVGPTRHPTSRAGRNGTGEQPKSQR